MIIKELNKSVPAIAQDCAYAKAAETRGTPRVETGVLILTRIYNHATLLNNMPLNLFSSSKTSLMKALIVFETTHGCTEQCAKLLKKKLLYETDIIRLKESPNPDLSSYNVVIIGGSIHMGEINTRVKRFYEAHQDELLTRNTGLYVCCMQEGEVALEQFEKAFPKKLRKHSSARGIFGGEFNLSRMNTFEKIIVKKLAGVEVSVSQIQEEELILFADRLNKFHPDYN